MKKSGVKIDLQTRSAIRKMYLETDKSLQQVADYFGVSMSVCHRIVHEADGDINVVQMLRKKKLVVNEGSK